jgi:hypothetical protein
VESVAFTSVTHKSDDVDDYKNAFSNLVKDSTVNALQAPSLNDG